MRTAIRRLSLLLLLAPAAGCASAGASPRAVASTIERRALQTRSYEAAPGPLVQALLSTFQDEGFRIVRTEPELGLVVAENASVSTPGLGKRLLSGYLKLATYGLFRGDGTRRSVIEAQAVVSRLGASANVRIALELRTLDRNGQLQERRAIDDGSIYQALFARLDKSLFLQREGL